MRDSSAGSRSGEPQREYTIQGRTVKLPVEVRDASCISGTFLVPTPAARELLAKPELELIEPWPRRTPCSVVGVEYLDNDLGRYNEVGVAFFVRPAGPGRGGRRLGGVLDLLRGRAGAYIHSLPVTTGFSCEAGRTVWGFPKFVAEIAFRDEGPRRSVTLAAHGRRILRLEVRARPRPRRVREAPVAAFSGLGGVVRRTPFASSAERAGFRLGGARLELGDHPLADELRRLGLPRRALVGARVEGMRMRFGAAEAIPGAGR